MPDFLLYGATGYTGELLAREAVRRGLRPLLAGRTATRLSELAHELGLPFEVVGLDDPARLEAVLQQVPLVLHCAGPFSRTAAPMVAACLCTGKHYLDITGEISVFEAVARQNEPATAAGIMLLPGVGFDVVPSDCLASHLHEQLPTATHLTLAFRGLGPGGMSHGTQATMLLNAGSGGAVRRNGRIVPVPAAYKTRRIDFGAGPVPAVTIPWGDVSTAYYSTGIPNIEVYTVLPAATRRLLVLSRYLGPVLSSRPMQQFLLGRLKPGGPTAAQREQGRTALYGEVRDDQGRRAAARLSAPEGYALTVLTALYITQKVLAGNWKPGFHTPATAYGSSLILEIPGVELESL